MTTRTKVPWSHWDRFLLIVLGLILVLIVGLSIWFHELDKNPEVFIPTPTPPAINAFDYYKAASEDLVDRGKIEDALYLPSIIGPKPPPHSMMGRMPGMRIMPGMGAAKTALPYTLTQKAKLISENAGAIQLLHTGFQFPYQNPPLRSVSAPTPYYANYRALARFLTLRAQVQAGQGDWHGAMASDLDTIQMGEEIPYGGVLIGMFVGNACQAIGRRRAWKAVDHLTVPQAMSAARRLEAIRARHVPFVQTLKEEKWSMQAALLELMDKQDWPKNLGFDLFQEDFGPSEWEKTVALLRIRLVGKRTIMANYTRAMNQNIANAQQAYNCACTDPDPIDPVSAIILPAGLIKARLNETKANAENALLLTMLALHAYQLDHGTYPATLSALTPNYLKAVPDDPFAFSSPLRYKRVGSSYLLYSVGPDGKDDGGKPIFDKTKPAPTPTNTTDQRYRVHEYSQGDIDAGVNIN